MTAVTSYTDRYSGARCKSVPRVAPTRGCTKNCISSSQFAVLLLPQLPASPQHTHSAPLWEPRAALCTPHGPSRLECCFQAFMDLVGSPDGGREPCWAPQLAALKARRCKSRPWLGPHDAHKKTVFLFRSVAYL
eukprot:gene17987-biopygen18930